MENTPNVDVTNKKSRPRCHSLSGIGSTAATASKKVQLDKCPCLKSNEASWKVKCCSCKQLWHASCANLKAKIADERVIISIEKLWQCPWCFVSPHNRPQGHPSLKNECQLMGTVISDTVAERLAEEVSHSIVPEFQLSVDNLVTSRIREMAKLIEFQGKELSAGMKELKSLKDRLLLLNQGSVSQTESKCFSGSLSQESNSTFPLTVNPTNHIEDFTENFLNLEEITCLKNELDSDALYTKVNGRQVASFGSQYKYSGSSGQNTPTIPPFLQRIIDKIHGNELYADANINQVVVNRYSGKTHLPEHSDNEASIRPESHVFTVSVGEMVPIIFRDKVSGREETISPNDGSLYVMSKSSQHYWTHCMEEIDLGDGVRISITFRSVGDNYKNSTIILGDSNTKHLKFSSGAKGEKGTFGYKIPGKRVETFHIGNIDPSNCIGYKNVVVHCGINDLRDSSPGRLETDPEPTDIAAHFQKLAEKVSAIKVLCPYASVHVSPVLPTRNLKLNQRVVAFNQMLFDFVANDKRGEGVKCLNFNQFLDANTGVLRDDLRVWDTQAGCYSRRDILHLGRVGVRLLAGCVREIIFDNHITSRSYSNVAQNSRSHHASYT